MTILPKYLIQDELQRFFKVIISPRDCALFALIYHYGLRVDEATALTVEDIDVKNHRIRIRRLKNGIGGEKPLWRHTAKLLRAYLRVRRNVTPYLFIGRHGPMKKRMIQHLFAHYAQAAGITTRNIHTLRHSIVFICLKPDAVSSMLLITWDTGTSGTRACMPRLPTPCAIKCFESWSTTPRL